MHIFILFSVLITFAAIFSYINIRVFRLPGSIMLMLMGTIFSTLLIIFGQLSPEFTKYIKSELAAIDFSEFLLGILLSFLLFAGSLHVNFTEMKKLWKSITSFATVGVIISTFLIGTGTFYLLPLFNIDIPFIACLLFGALISPTDPIAVMGILSKVGLSKSIEIRITGESLFNDGIGVVIFATILEVALKGIDNISALSVVTLFMQEAVGGIVAGLIIGYTGYKMMKSIDHFQTEILISLAMVMGGYSLCHYIHVSGPLAMVVAGLITGNKGKEKAMSEITMDYLEKFWEVTDEVLNAILFMLIGLQLVIIEFRIKFLFIGLIIALMLVIGRYISLWLPAHLFFFKNKLEEKTLEIMTWGGLRGGISIALALSIPENLFKDIFVSVTFVVVFFSIVVQGFTIEKLVKKLIK